MATSMMKQRLIGAAVLIALGVIFIPMLLTGDGKFLSGETQSNVPPKPMYELEAPKVLPLDKEQQPGSPAVKGATESAATETAESPPATADSASDTAAQESKPQQQIVEPVAVATRVEPASDKPDTKAESKTESKTVSKAESKAIETTKPVEASKAQVETSQAATKKAETSSAPSKQAVTVQAKAEAATATPIVTGWAVQLGSFSVQKNALNLRDKLRKKGYASFVEEYKRNGKSSYRVRVGPELTRDLANELKTKLKAETRIDGFVVEFSGK